MILLHGPGRCRQQQMGSQAVEHRLFRLIAAALGRHAPEGLVDAVFHKSLIDRVAVRLQTGLQNSPDDPGGFGVLQAGQGRHDCHLQLGRSGGGCLLGLDRGASACRIKESAIHLEAAAKRRRLLDAHLIHPHGDQVGTELLTVKLHIQQPVILRRFI